MRVRAATGGQLAPEPDRARVPVGIARASARAAMRPSSPTRPGAAVRWLVAATAVSTWALVAVGGMVRVSESGLGCPDWPLCNGGVVPGAEKEPIIEYTHRLTAAIVVVLLLLTTAAVLWRERARRELLLPLVAAVALVPVQALLGAIVVWLELPDRLVGVHFMVGMSMLALCTAACALAWRGDTVVSGTFVRAATVVAGVGLLLVSLGASVVATDGMHACGTEWPGCNGGLARGGGVAVLQVVHRTTAYTLVAAAAVLLVLGLRRHAPLRVAAPLAVLAVAQVGLGVGIVLTGHLSSAHDTFRVLHVAVAGAVWAVVVAVYTVAVSEPLVQDAAATARAGTRPLVAPAPFELEEAGP